MKIQSILLNKKYFSLNTALQWIVKHGFKHYKIDITKNKYRFRQQEPNSNRGYYTIHLKRGVEAICFSN